MKLIYLGISLPNFLRNPLKDKLNFCTAQELSATKISHDEYCGFLGKIKELDFVHEINIISTCNRFEVIAFVDNDFAELELIELRREIAEYTGSALNFNFLEQKEAKLQILRTYCGLNSGLVGEDEICEQMKIALRQASGMGFSGKATMVLLGEAMKLRKTIDAEVYMDYRVSYCDIALQKSFEKLKVSAANFDENSEVIVLGSGNTAKKSCLSLLKLGVNPKAITVVHRISCSSVQIENIRSAPELASLNFVRSKDGYRANKAKNIMLDADLIVFGIDTRSPVVDFDNSYKARIVDFNSHASCNLEDDANLNNYVSNIEADSFVRQYASEQIECPKFSKRIEEAENILQASALDLKPSLV